MLVSSYNQLAKELGSTTPQVLDAALRMAQTGQIYCRNHGTD